MLMATSHGDADGKPKLGKYTHTKKVIYTKM